MFFQNSDLKIVDINLDKDMDNDNKSVNSIEDELSHGSFIDSDMHEFNKMEKEIYGSQEFDMDDDEDEEIDDDDDTINNTDITEDKSESLQLIKPKIDKKPELGDPIFAYDKLQGRFDDKILAVQNNVQNGYNVPGRSSLVFSPAKSHISSRQSEETVLSQPDESDQPKTPINSYYFPVNSHSSSKENIESNGNHEDISASTSLHEKLAQEQAKRFEHEKHIEYLYESMNQLQSRHALAEETIDQLRLGSIIKPERIGLEQRAHSQHMLGTVAKRGNIRLRNNPRNNMNKRRSMAVDSSNGINYDNDITRRYSCVVGSMENGGLKNGYIDYGSPNIHRNYEALRARSVDNDLNEENYPVFHNSEQKMDEKANQLHHLSDRLLTRAQVIDEELQALNLNFEQHISSTPTSPMFYPQPQSAATKQKLAHSWNERLRNIQAAYDNLNREFLANKPMWDQQQRAASLGYADLSTLQATTEAKDQLESQLFSLSMQLDNLDQKMKDSTNSIEENEDYQPHVPSSPVTNNSSKRYSPQPPLIRSRALEVEQRVSELEDQYENLIGQYQNLKHHQPINNANYHQQRYQSPNQNNQKEVDDLIEQLRLVVFEANGRSPHIVSPQHLEELLGRVSSPTRHSDTENNNNNALLPFEPPHMKYQQQQQSQQVDRVNHLEKRRDSPMNQQQFGATSEEDRLSSATSSFKKGNWPSRRQSAIAYHNNKIDDIDGRSSSGGSSSHSFHHYRSHPAKSQSPIANQNEQQKFDRTHHQSYQPTSQAQSAISSVGTTATMGSMYHGATSGETLPVDENGVILIKEPLKVSTPMSSKFGSYKPSRSLNSGNSFASLPSDEDADRTNARYRRKPANSTQKLDDEVRSLDQQLALVQLEEEENAATTTPTTVSPHTSHHQHIKRPPYLHHNQPGSIGSRNTRSLLGTVSPSNDAGSTSRHSNKSPAPLQTNHGKSAAVRTASRHHVKSPITSDFYDYSDEYVGDVEDAASSQRGYSGIGPERRNVPRRNYESVDYVDRWCQTPSSYYHELNHQNGPSSYRGPPHAPTSTRWSMNSSPSEPPYYDHIDYWDGDSFHPERQQRLPGKSILRPPSQYGNFQVKGRHRGRVKKPLEDEGDHDGILDIYGSYPGPSTRNKTPVYHDNNRFPDNDSRSNRSRQSDPSAVRQYSQIGPHKYFVREYANQIPASNSPSNRNRYNDEYYDEDEYFEDDYLSDDPNCYTNYKKYLDQRRISHYIDDALQQVIHVRDHANRIQDHVYHNTTNPNRYVDYRPYMNGARPNLSPPPIPQHGNMPPIVPPHRSATYTNPYINSNYDSLPNRRIHPRFN